MFIKPGDLVSWDRHLFGLLTEGSGSLLRYIGNDRVAVGHCPGGTTFLDVCEITPFQEYRQEMLFDV